MEGPDVGGVVPVVNIPGLKTGELKLTGDIIADIYRGQIKKWNDPAYRPRSLKPGCPSGRRPSGQ